MNGIFPTNLTYTPVADLARNRIDASIAFHVLFGAANEIYQADTCELMPVLPEYLFPVTNERFKMTDSRKTIGAAVIAAGGRSRGVISNLLRDSDRRVKILSLFDPDKAIARQALDGWKSPDTRLCDSYQEAIRTPGVDWVLIFSPNAFHKEQILEAFAAGKHVFSEKPMATTIEDCEAIYRAHHASGRIFSTGFVHRYAPIYRKTREILHSGHLGKILSIDANENISPEHGGYIMTNWRRHTKLAGPHILEKCCHDLDHLNWFVDSLPSRVVAFGGLNFFIPENRRYMDEFGKGTFVSWGDPHGVDCPFTSDKDLMDNYVSILEYRNGVRVQFQATMSNAMPERRVYFSCAEGNLVVELYSATIQYRRIGDKEITRLAFTSMGHGGGDDVLTRELFECMTSGVPPKAGGNEGLESAVVALAIDRSIREKSMVDLEPVWKELKR